jgi:hypothetical protein
MGSAGPEPRRRRLVLAVRPWCVVPPAHHGARCRVRYVPASQLRGRMQKIKDAASEFLAQKRVAVTGVSRDSKDHGANVVYQRLRSRGYEVFAVNPNADEVEGDRCYHDVGSIPEGSRRS